MFRDMGSITDAEAEEMFTNGLPWLEKLIENGEYFGFLVVLEKEVVAGGGVIMRETGPVPGCLRVGSNAHIVNMYTVPHHRRRGLARKVMEAILEWGSTREVDHYTLTASDEGKPLYESLGFEFAGEMKLIKFPNPTIGHTR